MFERFTDDARRVIVYAQEESRRFGHDHIGTEHLLLGLLHDDTPTGAALATVGVTLDGAREQVEQVRGRGRAESPGHLPFTPRLKRALENALRDAQRLDQAVIARPHLLGGLLAVADGAGVQVLRDCGVDVGALTARAEALSAAVEPDGSGEAPITPRIRTTGRVPRRRHYLFGTPATGDGAEAQHDDLAAALRRYGRHDDGCDSSRTCSCGFQAILDNLDPPASD